MTIKTEHAGAKNGGGYWGKREEAKRRTKKARRGNDKVSVSLETEERLAGIDHVRKVWRAE